MSETTNNGSRRKINDRDYVFYDGYWIKYYEPPSDSLTAKKRLIGALTRRLFNHVEHGINIPGKRLEETRVAYEKEQDPAVKRVKGAMLAGALFNRATDIFTHLVELQDLGVEIEPNNSLMQECGRCLMESLEFGKTVRHRSGVESIDELWGEPFKAFSIPVEAFYNSRYVKIALTMRDIDRIANTISQAFAASHMFPGLQPMVMEFAEAAKLKCETLRTDPEIFEIWPKFVAAGERLCANEPQLPMNPSKTISHLAEKGTRLIKEGHDLLNHIARARVSMPKRTAVYLEQCEAYRKACEKYCHGPGQAPASKAGE